ncbi:CLUMA_CG002157, isoform A [Clunio marinus]|uniref:CLUMA_CG002157, isoform A n=1 Tax=Clunio marinus TaxID=568069 RepID=A0A1J1HLU8_9DIPT|nr:CLUMA_CG002157, isoform A [Clunio marinus]
MQLKQNQQEEEKKVRRCLMALLIEDFFMFPNAINVKLTTFEVYHKALMSSLRYSCLQCLSRLESVVACTLNLLKKKTIQPSIFYRREKLQIMDDVGRTGKVFVIVVTKLLIP